MRTLIADSGIQFVHKQVSIPLDNKYSAPILLWHKKEEITDDQIRYKLELAHQLDNGQFVPKLLLDFGPKGEVLNTDFSYMPHIDESEILKISRVEKFIEKFQGLWLPVPFFPYDPQTEESDFGPTGWCRMLLSDLRYTSNDKKEQFLELKVIFAFDTVVTDNSDITLSETDLSEEFNYFSLSKNDDINLRFISESYTVWVDDYLLSSIHGGTLPNTDFPLKYLGQYLYLIKSLASLENNNKLDKIILYPNNDDRAVGVDLVLDIGNSRTCGLLFEEDKLRDSQGFGSVRELKLTNLSNPAISYNDPFSMRLVFHKSNFGDIDVPQMTNLFVWPSVLRIGNEAENLLNSYDLPTHLISEPANTCSSPKRYLWDSQPADKPWEYITIKDDKKHQTTKNEVVLYHLNEQFTSSGELIDGEDNFGVQAKWSRGSLMTFVYIELIAHAMQQINSHDFREKNHEELGKPRRLKRIVITCPTGMSEEEQLRLRKSAKDATKALERYYKAIQKAEISSEQTSDFDLSGINLDDDDFDTADIENIQSAYSNIEIIPNPDSLLHPDPEHKEDWIFDEATCSQINFLYSELAHKYKNNFDQFFDLYGKESGDDPGKSLTIASVDIGGGTTDLMICNYSYEGGDMIKPKPLYWETFTKAGDDLMKEIINQLLIDGSKDENGVLKSYAIDKNCTNVVAKIHKFFTNQASDQEAIHNLYRKSFVQQVLVPIAIKVMNAFSSGEKQHIQLTYEEIFEGRYPNQQLVEYINKNFEDGFDFQEIKWRISLDDFNHVVNNQFLNLFRQISAIIFASKADYLLLSGKPSEIHEVRNIFLCESSLSPNRIINLSNYRLGNWYPFSNEFGFLKDSKTTVAVGAMIYTLGGKYKNLKGLTIDISELKSTLKSTANYIGKYNSTKESLDEIYLDKNANDTTIKDIRLPLIIGFKQLKSNIYPASSLYILDFNRRAIYKRIKEQNPGFSNQKIEQKVKDQIKNWRNAKYNVTITRDIEQSKERIQVEELEANSEVFPTPTTRHVQLNLMTAMDPNGYWLDTGEFIVLKHK